MNDGRVSRLGRSRGLKPAARFVCATFALACFSGLGFTSCSRDKSSSPDDGSASAKRFAFTDVAEEAGVNHLHHAPILDHKLDNIMRWVCSVGAAVAAADFDNDGWIDLYVTDSRKGTVNHLYRNQHDGTFADVASSAGVADLNGELGTSMDCIWGDVDNDGWADLYVVLWGRDRLFHNNGDSTFTEITSKVFRRRDGSPGTDWANGNAAIFLDYNQDGRLDLYVGNYFQEHDLWNLSTTRIMHDGFEKSRNGGRNFLYRQEADGTFSEVAKSLGVDDPGWTLAVGSADINNDGIPDLYCADDFGPDQLFLGAGGGTFTNVSESAIGPDTKKGMNVDFGDFNNDGWLDIYVTNITTAEYLQEGNMLWHNNGGIRGGALTLTDVSLETSTYDGGWGWGGKFFDYDNDGDLDIIAVNGFISAGEGNYWYDLASWTVTGSDSADARNWPPIGTLSFSGYETTRLFRNDGLISFTQRAGELGIASDRDGRGVACFDYDNDGDLDVFIANQGQKPHLYRNDAAGGNNWLVVKLETDATAHITRDAVGTRVTIVTASGRQIRERDGGNSYSGQSDPRLHFGLGASSRVELMEVRWPDGGLQYVENIDANQLITIRRDLAQYVGSGAIAVAQPTPWLQSEQPAKPKPPEIDPLELDQMLSFLEEQLTGQPAEYGVASRYRDRCARYDRHDRAIKFFEQRVRNQPDDSRSWLELSCAYVDKMPTCGGVAAIVCKGSLAKKSLDCLDRILGADGPSWAVLYCRGMNHLHWPRALRHSKRAVADFRRCIRIQESDPTAEQQPYYVRIFVALGDAHAKAGEFEPAKAAWRQGLTIFPHARELQERLALPDNAAILRFVEDKRNLQQTVDTGLSFLDQSP